MLEDWHDFYILLGTAASALVALLFVAASIGASMLTSNRTRATPTYLSPVVFHSAILFASLVALIPTRTLLWLGISVGSVALAGLALFTLCLLPVIPRPRRRHRRPPGLWPVPGRRLLGSADFRLAVQKPVPAAANVVDFHGASGG